MRLIRIGMANIDTTVGAFRTNTDMAIKAANDMGQRGCTIGHLQEQVIPGYPSEDLAQWKRFLSKQWDQLLRFALATQLFPTAYGVSLLVEHMGHIYNAVAVVCKGKIRGLVPKQNLPTYGVFYEGRVCSPWPAGLVETYATGIPIGDLAFKFPFGIAEWETCEDVWVPNGPMLHRAYAGAEVALNCSSSPFRVGVLGTRREMLPTRSGDNCMVLAYTNQVGGNDSLVFDGGMFLYDNGRKILEGKRWIEQVVHADVDLDRTARIRHENTTWRNCARAWLANPANPRPQILEVDGPAANHKDFRFPVPATKSFFIPSNEINTKSPREEYFEDLEQAEMMGLDGYYRKTKAFKCIGIALSGGKDSCYTAYIAWKWAVKNGIDPKNIHCFSFPSTHNSDTTRSISRILCEELGLTFVEVSIQDDIEREEANVLKMLPPGSVLDRATRQNIQARIRGQRMWNWTNMTGGLWLQTGNMSEKAVGYTTVGGDMEGAYSLISNRPKSTIKAHLVHVENVTDWEWVRLLNATKESAELESGQEDEKDLMPFPVLDACFALFVGEKMDIEDVKRVTGQMWTDEELRAMDARYETGTLDTWVDRFAKLFIQSIFKWVQTCEGVHEGSIDLDRERALQLPVVQSKEWLTD